MVEEFRREMNFNENNSLAGRVTLLNEGIIIGSVGFKSVTESNIHMGDSDVGQLYVVECFRRQGYGSRIVSDAVEYISEMNKEMDLGIKKILTDVDAKDTVVRSLLDKAGFRDYKDKQNFLEYSVKID